MSAKAQRNSGSNSLRKTSKRAAKAFAALGDETRLHIVGKLAGGEAQSITGIASGSKLSRQAITKHLRVLEGAGLVHCERAGREALFALNPQPIEELKTYLDIVSEQWDEALMRLKNYVEREV